MRLDYYVMELKLPVEMKTKEQDIILAAAELFERYGFQRVRVEEICRYAGASKATFYKYFSGKDALVERFLSIVFKDMLQRTYAVLDSDISLKEKFDRVIILKMDFIKQLGDEILHSLFDYPAAHAFYKKISQSSMRDFHDFLQREQNLGRIDLEINLELFMGLLTEIAQIYSDKSLDKYCHNINELVSQVNRLLIYGIFPRGNA